MHSCIHSQAMYPISVSETVNIERLAVLQKPEQFDSNPAAEQLDTGLPFASTGPGSAAAEHASVSQPEPATGLSATLPFSEVNIDLHHQLHSDVAMADEFRDLASAQVFVHALQEGTDSGQPADVRTADNFSKTDSAAYNARLQVCSDRSSCNLQQNVWCSV